MRSGGAGAASRVIAIAVAITGASAACHGPEAGPSEGHYTLQFPSTEAAIATDLVQVLVYDPPEDPDARGSYCTALLAARKRKDTSEKPSVNPPAPAVNVCDLLDGKRPMTVPYGDHAILVIAQRKNASNQLDDFMIGCAIETVGDGDLPLAVALSLVDVANPIPDTTCGSVREFCSESCQ